MGFYSSSDPGFREAGTVAAQPGYAAYKAQREATEMKIAITAVLVLAAVIAIVGVWVYRSRRTIAKRADELVIEGSAIALEASKATRTAVSGFAERVRARVQERAQQ